MTKLDIELKKQTADVSITEMMQEADSMGIELQRKSSTKTEQNQLGK